MKNSKGSTIALALSAMLIFSGLGVGAIGYSTMQGHTSISGKLSTQAFWLADAGIEAAKGTLQTAITNNLLSQTYQGTVNTPKTTALSSLTFFMGSSSNRSVTNPDPASNDLTKYLISTRGQDSNNQRKRTIHAVYQIPNINASNFNYGLMAESTSYASIKLPLGVHGSQIGSLPTFESIFGGLTIAVAEQIGTALLASNPSGWGTLSTGIYYAKASNATPITIPSNTLDGSSALLIIDGNLSLGGVKNFSGVIWVTGNLDFTGTGGTLNGSIFVAGALTGNGNPKNLITYDSAAIQNTINNIKKPIPVSWQEISE